MKLLCPTENPDAGLPETPWLKINADLATVLRMFCTRANSKAKMQQ